MLLCYCLVVAMLQCITGIMRHVAAIKRVCSNVQSGSSTGNTREVGTTWLMWYISCVHYFSAEVVELLLKNMFDGDDVADNVVLSGISYLLMLVDKRLAYVIVCGICDSCVMYGYIHV